MTTISRRSLLKKAAATTALLAVPRMVHSQVVSRRAPQSHWDMVLASADEAYLKRWMATARRDPARRIPGLIVLGQQEAKMFLDGIGPLFPDRLVTGDWTVHVANVMKGNRCLNIYENPEKHLLYHAGRHEQLVAQYLSIHRSTSHWVETCESVTFAGPKPEGTWLKTLRLGALKRPVPELTKLLAEEREAFCEALKQCDLLDDLPRLPVSYANLLRKIS